MSMGLTLRQHEVLEFIGAYMKADGFGPSQDEIRVDLGFKSKSRVVRIIDALVERGAIRRLARCARGLQLIDAEDDHPSYCSCDGCAKARYLAQYKMVQAISVLPPVRLLKATPDNIALISDEDRAALLGVEPRRAAPRVRTAIPTVAQ